MVPELPQSMSPLGAVSCRERPWTIKVVGSGRSISTPSARMACMVERQSSLARKPVRTQVPLESAARMTARCEMLLSPGTVISARITGPCSIFQLSMFNPSV